MPDVSEEQTWWSNLFTGGTDPALEIPDGVWESVVEGVFDTDNAGPADDLLPVSGIDVYYDEWAEAAEFHLEVGQTATHDAGNGGGLGETLVAEHEHSIDHQVVYDAEPDDFDIDSPDPTVDEF